MVSEKVFQFFLSVGCLGLSTVGHIFSLALRCTGGSSFNHRGQAHMAYCAFGPTLAAM